MAIPQISLAQARRLQLHALGLLRRSKGKATPAKLLESLRQMQLLQIDTISVVARSPYLVLHSRLGDYRSEWLDQALRGGQVFETWAHEACFAPIDDVPWHRQRQRGRDGHWAMKHAQRVSAKHPVELQGLLDHIESHGPVRSSDFPQPPKTKLGWWEWKPEKRWLEALFAQGELMITRREGFQRVYDLSTRVLAQHRPGWNDDRLPGDELTRRWMVERSILALGVSTADWISDYYRLQKRVSEAELQPLLDEGVIQRVQVSDWARNAYVHCDHQQALDEVRAGSLRATHTALLSPFDPLTWDRRRAGELFDFQYKLECYTPAHKRRWGYFVLPLLHAGQLIGRIDAKARRKDRVLELRQLHLQPGAPVSERAIAAVAHCLQQFAAWHQTDSIEVGQIHHPQWAKMLPGLLQA